MISVVVYGRNDSYGYNLHKRAALGLNCMAEILSHADDEILFVDYNTPDDHPTFPEAIADTLTPRAIERLRVLRVRPDVHRRFAALTHLPALEPVARNIAVRRSNPANRWILSTNTDMVFVPRGAGTLSEIAADQPPGYYHLPRFELPESLWEGLDRTAPAAAIRRVREFGERLLLDEIVYRDDYIKYDQPGDFQLILRDDLFHVHGFDERMLRRWHVDSNIAKRLYLLYGAAGSVADGLLGYHCEHTRQVSPTHQFDTPRNDCRRFVDEVRDPDVPEQAESWGCPSDDLEEIRLSRSSHHVFVETMQAVVPDAPREPLVAHYVTETFGPASYDARHIAPYLADLFASAPRGWTLGWFGADRGMFQLFHRAWHGLGFTGGILVEPWCRALLDQESRRVVRATAMAEINACADALVFDFGTAPESSRGDPGPQAYVRESFARLAALERTRMAGGAAPRRFICVNAIHNEFEAATLLDIAASATPFSTRLRHGFVKGSQEFPSPFGASEQPYEAADLLPRLHVEEGGTRTDAGVHAPAWQAGVVLHGPHVAVPAGDYELEISLRARGLGLMWAQLRPVTIEVSAGHERLSERRVTFRSDQTLVVPFTVSGRLARTRTVYARLVRGRFADFVVTKVRLRLLRPFAGDTAAPDDRATHGADSESAEAEKML